MGLSASTAAERRRKEGPNALPEERPVPGWRRFLDEYRSYMEHHPLAAAVVSLVIAEWGTAVLLIVLTLLNAVIAHRPGGQGGERDERPQLADEGDARGCAGTGSSAEIPAKELGAV